jgi:hypothetical protein
MVNRRSSLSLYKGNPETKIMIKRWSMGEAFFLSMAQS